MIRKLILFLFCLLALPAAALADAEYSITQYYMDVQVLPDGGAEVTETLLYDFDGEYNGILSLFDADGTGGIEDLRLTIDGEPILPVDEMNHIPNTYTLSQDGSLIEVRSYSPGRDDTRLVVYEYRMAALAERYEDAGMILRSFIGGNNSVSLRDAVVRVSFPEEAGLQAFVHGAMQPEDIHTGPDYVEFGPKTVSPDSFAEMRILFPTELIGQAPLKEGNILESALAEEARLIEEAERTAQLTETAKYLFSAAYTVIFLIVWLLLARRYGLKGRVKDTPDIRRLSAWPAAFAQAAVEEAPDTAALSGSLMELVLMRRVRMDSTDDDLIFTLTDRSQDGLQPHHIRLIGWLFGGGDSFSLSSLNAGEDYQRARSFEEGYAAYTEQVAKDMLSHRLRYKNDGLRISVNALIILLGTVGAGYILVAGTPNVFLGIFVALVLYLLLRLMSRVRTLTDEGERLRMDAQALIAAGILPEDTMAYLPFYTALGMTEPLIAAAEGHIFPEENFSLLCAGWHYRLHAMTSSLRDAHHHNASVPDPSASSSSGVRGGSAGRGGGHGAW